MEGEALRLPSSPPSSSLPVISLTGENAQVLPPGERGAEQCVEQAAALSGEPPSTLSPSVVAVVGDKDVIGAVEEKGPEQVDQHEPEPVQAVDLTDELRAQIVRQVEYYFSDENLPTDKFLLRFVKKDHGFVPIGVIASFRKVKKLVKDDVSLIVSAIRTSTNLVVSSDGKKVRSSNSNKLPIISKVDDTKLRTVVVENLPEEYSEEMILQTFSQVGKVVKVTMQGPNNEEGSMYGKKAFVSNKIHALVEYSSIEEAENSVAKLNDRNNWRTGIRVELLQKRKGFTKFDNFVTKGKDAKVTNGDGNKDDTDHDGIVKEKKARNKNRHKYHTQNDGKQQGHGSGTIGSSSEITSKPLPGPRMPDGTRGFTMGRGKPIVTSQPKPQDEDA